MFIKFFTLLFGLSITSKSRSNNSINDSSLSMVKIWEKLFFDERYTATDNPNNLN